MENRKNIRNPIYVVKMKEPRKGQSAIEGRTDWSKYTVKYRIMFVSIEGKKQKV